MPNNSVEHLQCIVKIRFRKVQRTLQCYCRFLQNLLSISTVPRCRLAPPVPSPLSLHRTSAWSLADIGDKQEEVRRPVTDASGGFAAARGRRGADGATQRRPSHRSSPRGLPLPRTRCHPRREPQGVERALCRRRARAATSPWTGAVTPRPTEISGERHQ